MAAPALITRQRYSWPDRLLHRLAFATVAAQKGAADIEDRLFARRIAGIKIDRPVFIAALPRAGTTLLLELLSGLPDFVSHTYRDLPFLLTPLLWDALSRPFRSANAVMERAHGDGMTVGYDSPEAFEELLWHSFWPEKYRADRIIPWTAEERDANDEFAGFIYNHIRKMLSLRAGGGDGAGQVRYVSKNNANIARIPVIRRLFPDAVILVPFRNPVDQAGSMLRQHRNFTDIHAQDAFSRRYMAYTGHFDFGANLRPIDCGGWLDDVGRDTPDTANFWLRYWCAAYEHILANRNDGAVLISYDYCCAHPEIGLHSISAAVGLDMDDRAASVAARFRPATGYDAVALGLTPALAARADAVYQRLRHYTRHATDGDHTAIRGDSSGTDRKAGSDDTA